MRKNLLRPAEMERPAIGTIEKKTIGNSAESIGVPAVLNRDNEFCCGIGKELRIIKRFQETDIGDRSTDVSGPQLSRSGKPKHRIRRLREITEWFNQYLKGETPCR